MTVGFHRESLWAPHKYQINFLYGCQMVEKGVIVT